MKNKFDLTGMKMIMKIIPAIIRSGFKTSDQIQGQGVPRIESRAYTLVREHFEVDCNTAIGQKMRVFLFKYFGCLVYILRAKHEQTFLLR